MTARTALVLLILTALGCAAPTAPASGGFATATVDQAKALADASPAPAVLDVREPAEFEAGHIPGASNRPLGQLATWAPALAPQARYLVVCQTGIRSADASGQLAARGFTQVTSMAGGMADWQAKGFPTVKEPSVKGP